MRLTITDGAERAELEIQTMRQFDELVRRYDELGADVDLRIAGDGVVLVVAPGFGTLPAARLAEAQSPGWSGTAGC